MSYIMYFSLHAENHINNYFVSNFNKMALVHAQKDRPKYVKLLLDAGADVNIRDTRNHTPLMSIMFRTWNSGETRPTAEDEEFFHKILQVIHLREGHTKRRHSFVSKSSIHRRKRYRGNKIYLGEINTSSWPLDTFH